MNSIHLFSFFIITYCSSIASSNYAMEKETPIIGEFSITGNKCCAAFISNEEIIITGNPSRIININTKKETALNNINTNRTPCLSQNKKYFMLYHKSILSIYDKKTKKNKLNTNVSFGDTDLLPECLSNQHKNTVLMGKVTETKKELMLYNYKTKNILSTSINKNLYPSPTGLHPTKQQICSQYDDTISLYEYDPQEKNYKKTALLKKCNAIDYPSIKYSPNGSLIALCDENNIEIINILFNYNIPSITYTVQHTENNFYHTIQFHPNNAILAAMLPTESDFIKLHYLESNKKHIFAEYLLPTPNYFYCEFVRNEAISFSPNGKYIMIQFNTQCVIRSVPTKVIYHPEGAHSKTFLAYCLLKEFSIYHNNLLPYDVIQLITNTLFEAFNYS